jgi:hypothetical protein
MNYGGGGRRGQAVVWKGLTAKHISLMTVSGSLRGTWEATRLTASQLVIQNSTLILVCYLSP